jgi:HAD superfamily hydrolase (TIGR01490 family)
MSIAFFDLDKTLIAQNSAQLWIKTRWKEREIKLHHMISASYWLARYHLGFTKFDNIIEKSLMIIEGEKESKLLEQTKSFFHDTIRHLYRPGALEALKKHRDLGHSLSLLTSSFDGLSLLVKEDLKLDYCLCTRLEVNDLGLYTGKTLGPACFGANKVIFAQELAQKLNVNLLDCSFYTDSATDIPLLNLVGRAVAVNPDPHLRTRAQMKKWEIVDWGTPSWMNKAKIK